MRPTLSLWGNKMKTARAQFRSSIRNDKTINRRPVKQTHPRTSVLKGVPRQSRPLQRRATPCRRAALAVVRPNGLSVFGLLAVATAGLVLLFVLALNWQRQAYQSGQSEVALRSQLDQTLNERRQLVVDQERALSPRENDLRSRRVGLSSFKLEERTATAQASAKPPLPSNKPKPGNPVRPPASAPNSAARRFSR